MCDHCFLAKSSRLGKLLDLCLTPVDFIKTGLLAAIVPLLPRAFADLRPPS